MTAFRSNRINSQKMNLNELEPIVKGLYFYNEGETFEALVIRMFKSYYEQTEKDITNKLSLKFTSERYRLQLIAKAILGVKNKKIEEFEKADVVMKTIRLEKSGLLKKGFSFSQIQFKEIINEDWEESYWHYTLTKRFFFVVFQKDENDNLKLEKVFFWTMPVSDLETARIFWEDMKQKIINNDFNHFIKISDKKIFHIRPKGRNAKDLIETARGTLEKEKCYWLNADYIKSIIREETL
ncbi:MAG: hypothetical protein P4L41_17130 [Flavipsychrobacter sp.]|nr:hypothetical protein [Flavipsychrobacter sp.]